MTPRRLWRYAAKLGLLLMLAALVIPDAGRQPTSISLTTTQSAKDVDFGDGVVWLLLLGSDARGGEDILRGRTDAIQLVGLDLDSGRAAGLGIPRDAWLELPGDGLGRINEAMQLNGDPDDTAEVVADLLGIPPDYVFVAGFEGYRDMVDTIDGVDVKSDREFTDPEFDLHVEKGVNHFDGTQALDYARTREGTSDFVRSAQQQQMMLGILQKLRAREDEEGFLEAGTLSALSGLRTDLAPNELYRLAQAVTLVRPDRVETCVLTGTDLITEDGAAVIELDGEQVQRVSADLRDNLRYDDGC